MACKTHFAGLSLLALTPILLFGGPGVEDKEGSLIAAMKFVKVPKGAFWMGWSSFNPHSKRVEIKQEFELAAYTVTQEQWEAVMGTNPSYFSRRGQGKAKVANVTDADLKRFPVESVSWDDVQRFLKKLNAREKGKGWTYRLPTEAEWEFACRNAATDKAECSFNFYFAKGTNSLSSKDANINRARPTTVGSYAPNKLGLYDMHGNVAQWCDDLWSEAEPDLGRVTRGGSWHSTFVGRYCEAGRRMVLGQSDRYFLQGFRVARVRSERK